MARASDLGLARSVEGEAEVLFPADTKNLFGKFVLCGTPCPRPPSYPQASFRGIRKLALSRFTAYRSTTTSTDVADTDYPQIV